jgi:hypothetical protein
VQHQGRKWNSQTPGALTGRLRGKDSVQHATNLPKQRTTKPQQGDQRVGHQDLAETHPGQEVMPVSAREQGMLDVSPLVLVTSGDVSR